MRLDNSSDVIINHFDLDFDTSDPGATEPVDLCLDCLLLWMDKYTIDSPPYNDGEYNCAECGAVLTFIDEIDLISI